MKREEDGKHVGWIYEYECTDENLKDWYGFNYVGQTRQKCGVNGRNRGHKNDSITHFDRVYAKHPESFELRIIDEIVRDTEEELILELNYLETYYIMAFYSFNDWGVRGFNHTMGGGVGVVSEETRKKHSDVNKKRFEDIAERRKQSEAIKKMWQNPEFRKKISEIYSTPDAKKKRSESMKKVYSTQEARQKMSERFKKRYENPAERIKQSERSIKMWQNENYRKKASEHTTQMWQNPEIRQKISEANKGKHNKPCQILDIETGFYWDFNSSIEACEWLGIDKRNIARHKTKPYKKRYIYIP